MGKPLNVRVPYHLYILFGPALAYERRSGSKLEKTSLRTDVFQGYLIRIYRAVGDPVLCSYLHFPDFIIVSC